MQNCCKKWEDVKVTPTQLKKIAQDTKDFLTSNPKKSLDELFDDNRKVLIPDVRNQTWLVHLGKFYTEMLRLKRKAEKTIGILSTGLNTYICTQPMHGCTTACVGGGELMFYMPFILSIKSDDVAFVYGHELYHTYQDIPARIISHINKDSDRRYELLPVIKGRRAENPTPQSIIDWYRKNHDLINIAADYEDNYILQRVGLVDEVFLTGGTPLNPRFCYRKEYGKKPFEKIFDELRQQNETNRAKEKEFKPKKKTIINGPVIIEDPDEDADDDEEDDDDSQDGTTVIDGPVHVSDNGKKPKGDPGEVEINGPIIDNRTKKPEDDDPFPGEIGNDGKNNSDGSPGKSEKDDEGSGEGDGNDSEGSEGSEGTGNGSGEDSEGSEGAGNGSGDNSEDGAEGSEGSEGAGNGSGDNSEGSEGSEDGSGESGSGNGGKNVPSKGEGGGGHGNKDIDSKIEDAKKLSDAIDEWIRRRTGVSEWKGGLFSGTLAGTLSPKDVDRCMRIIGSALSAGTITKLKGIITHSCETIVSGVNKQGRWGSRGHLWKKEVRPYNKNTRADAKINLVYMFDNSGSMGAPLICSFIDCLTAVWKEYEDVIEKIVMIPMRSKFKNGDTDVIICSDISRISSAKLAIMKIASDDNDTSFNTAIAVLKDPKIINPSDYNVFLNVGDREWKRDIASVPELCDLVRTYCRRNNFNVKDMFVSCITQLKYDTDAVRSSFDSIFDSYGVNTIKIGKDTL